MVKCSGFGVMVPSSICSGARACWVRGSPLGLLRMRTTLASKRDGFCSTGVTSPGMLAPIGILQRLGRGAVERRRRCSWRRQRRRRRSAARGGEGGRCRRLARAAARRRSAFPHGVTPGKSASIDAVRLIGSLEQAGHLPRHVAHSAGLVKPSFRIAAQRQSESIFPALGYGSGLLASLGPGMTGLQPHLAAARCALLRSIASRSASGSLVIGEMCIARRRRFDERVVGAEQDVAEPAPSRAAPPSTPRCRRSRCRNRACAIRPTRRPA